MKITLAAHAPKPDVRTLFVENAGENTQELFRDADGRRILKMPTGKSGAITLRTFGILARKIASAAKSAPAARVVLSWNDISFPELENVDASECASIFAQNIEMANFEFVSYKTPPESGWKMLEEIIMLDAPASLEEGFKKGQTIGREVNACRTLANTPGGDMTPALLAEEAKKAARGTRITVTVLGMKEMKALNMGAVLGVAAGSDHEPKFIIMEYAGLPRSKLGGGKAPEKPIVFAGKGVTFDTGGINLKPGDSSYEMHMDMSGGAAVIHAIVLAAKLGLKKNVVALVPAVENMPSGSSYRPGDILRSMSGKTIEIVNTDAEGRVILADALTYAKRYHPRLVVDVATLTGAVLIALGQQASGIMTNDKKLQDLFCELGEESGDYVWPFPLWDEYDEMVKGTFGDVPNIPQQGNSRYGGVIGGGMFLKQFAEDYPWVHIDMASRMTAASNEYLAKGAAGAPVRLLLKLIERY